MVFFRRNDSLSIELEFAAVVDPLANLVLGILWIAAMSAAP